MGRVILLGLRRGARVVGELCALRHLGSRGGWLRRSVLLGRLGGGRLRGLRLGGLVDDRRVRRDRTESLAVARHVDDRAVRLADLQHLHVRGRGQHARSHRDREQNGDSGRVATRRVGDAAGQGNGRGADEQLRRERQVVEAAWVGLEREARARVRQVRGGDVERGAPEPVVAVAAGLERRGLGQRLVAVDREAVVDEEGGIQQALAWALNVPSVHAQEHAAFAGRHVLEAIDFDDEGLAFAAVRFLRHGIGQ